MKSIKARKSGRQLQQLEKRMARAGSADQWLELAAEHDRLSGAAQWRRQPVSRRYDHASIRRRLDRLQALQRDNDTRGMLFALHEGIHGNMAGMGRSSLYRRAYCGTKQLIEEYIDAIVLALQHLAVPEGEQIPLVERLDFFQRASHCYGRSALMLSGGGTLGYFHFGVLKTLIEEELCPVVISGASAGAFVSAVVGTRTDEEYLALFENNFLARAMTSNRGNLKIGLGMDEERDMPIVRQEMARLIPDMTFLEAYRKTGRSINIAISPAEPGQESRLLNHIASPTVTIRSAVLASTALPGVFPSVQLEARDDQGEVQPYLPRQRWIDGSFSQDLPAKRLARMYGVNHFIVSQVMPGLGRESFGGPGIYQIVSDAWVAGAKQLVRGSLHAAQRYTRLGARTGSALNAINGLIDQQFTGDINIFPPYGFSSLGKILKILSEEEMIDLLHAGERGTWPKLPAIRTTTRIGRTLDRILHELELQQAHWLQSAPKTAAYRRKPAVKKAARGKRPGRGEGGKRAAGQNKRAKSGAAA